jgi:hypothetical protein
LERGSSPPITVSSLEKGLFALLVTHFVMDRELARASARP